MTWLMALVVVFPAAAESAGTIPAKDAALRDTALDAMRRAAGFFRSKIATQGGYLWEYSLDLKQRAGEGKATPTQIWVQPPGTPTVGEAFLRAYRATGDTSFLDGAIGAAHALAWGQLASGGWDYLIDFDSEKSKKWVYRRDVGAGVAVQDRRVNVTTFDDDTSQSALRFLMRIDRALGGRDTEVRQAVEYALGHFLMAQYPNGAWPQRYWAKTDPAKRPVLKGHYPDTWSRVYTKEGYGGYYTFNDSTIPDCIDTMLLAYELYSKPEYLASARKGGDFILLAQMPDPQPVWAQQYNANMEPAWARKFEPPSVTASESIGAMKALTRVFEATGDAKYIETLPRAFEWYKRSRLPDGRWARFYELKTNKPLYFTRGKYELTYDGSDTPTHYAFKGDWNPAQIEAWYAKVTQGPRDQWHARARQIARERSQRSAPAKPAMVRKIVDALDGQGRWVSGEKILCQTFSRNMNLLSDYVAAKTGEHHGKHD
jgi:hypothetical protein